MNQSKTDENTAKQKIRTSNQLLQICYRFKDSTDGSGVGMSALRLAGDETKKEKGKKKELFCFLQPSSAFSLTFWRFIIIINHIPAQKRFMKAHVSVG